MNMDKLLNKQDIQEFIISEKKTPTINNIHKTLKLFIKCIYKSIVEIYFKLKDLENIDYNLLIYNSCLLIYNVYWIIYSNSYNIKLTLFLTERSILLYTEFIIMSRNPSLNTDFNFIPNIKDAMNFSLKKTIGSLKYNSLKNKKMNDLVLYYRTITYDIKNIYYNLLTIIIENKKSNTSFLNIEHNEIEIKILDENKILHFFDKILILLYKQFISIYKNNFNKKGFQYKYFNIISNVLNLDIDLQNIIYIFKIIVELINYNQKLIMNSISSDIIDLIINNIEEKDIHNLNIKNLHINIKKKKLKKIIEKINIYYI